MPDEGRARFSPALGATLLGVLVLGVFLPTLRNDFICYDDNGYVTENAWVQSGLTWANVGHAFKTTEIAYWHPLTWISHLVDVELFGLQPWGHHLTSVLWHTANAALLFLLLQRATGATGRSWVVAALFGLHPLHVESVAWVAERKDVLSTFFSLVAIGCYGSWVKRRGWLAYAGALVAFAAGLMSKPMVVTLPCALLLLDYWPLNRWRGGIAGAGRLVVEKLPFLALAALAGVAAVRAQAALGTLQSTTNYSLTVRVVNALVAYGRYLEKCFWPAKLAVFYPHPGALPLWQGALAGLLLAGFTGVAVTGAWRRPWLPVGWFWFLGILVPVIGLVQVGGQAMADRYSYVPLIGIFVMIVWGAAEIAAQRSHRAAVLGTLAIAALAACAILTSRQIRLWRDSPTLFTHALAVTEKNWTAHFCLGYFYSKDPARLDDAIAEYRETARLTPGAAEAHFSLAAMLARRPDALGESAAEFETALRLEPNRAEAHLGLGQVLLRLPGREASAMRELAAAHRLAPTNPKATDELAIAHLRRADSLSERPETVEAAVEEYRAVLRLQPDWIEVRNNAGIALASVPGRLEEAIAEYEAVLRAKPEFADAHANLANALARIPERAAEAEREYTTALRLQPGDFRAHFNYGQFLLRFSERRADAAEQFEAALRAKPDLEIAREILGRLRTAGQ